MAKYFYDETTDTLYIAEGYSNDSSGWGWFAFFILLLVPFFIVGVWVREAAAFIFSHPVLSAIIYAALSFLLGFFFYFRKRIKHKALGIVAVVVSFVPVAIIQVCFALPEMLENVDTAGFFSNVFGWIIVTFFSVGICVFLNLICGLLKNGVKHLVASTVYLAIVAALFVVF